MTNRRLKISVMILMLMLTSIIFISVWRSTWKITSWPRSFFQTDASDRVSPKTPSSIFFLETSGKPALTLREVCSVESAALHNPNHSVQLYSIAPFQFDYNSAMQTLSRIANVKLRVMQVSEVFRNTPLSSWYSSGLIRKSAFPIYHLSDATRLAILWKSGGIYLDLDTITLRPLGGLTNALALQSSEDVANGILAFEKHSPFLNACMTEFARVYRPREWGFQGPILVTNMLRRACNTTLLANVINRPEQCQDIRLFPRHSFLPVHWRYWREILLDNAAKFNLTDSYTVHLYGALSHNTTVRPKTGVLLDILAKENCPETYEWMLINDQL